MNWEEVGLYWSWYSRYLPQICWSGFIVYLLAMCVVTFRQARRARDERKLREVRKVIRITK